MRKGFTLIETIIYAAILAAISALAIGSILMVLKSFSALRINRKINSSAVSALERLSREVRLADSVDITQSVFDVNPGKLYLNTIDPKTEQASSIEFYLNGDILMVKEGAFAAEALTSPDVGVGNLVFRRIFNASTSEAVKIEMDLASSQKLEKFYDTVTLRRSY